jgi:hypothetical protein
MPGLRGAKGRSGCVVQVRGLSAQRVFNRSNSHGSGRLLLSPTGPNLTSHLPAPGKQRSHQALRLGFSFFEAL